MDACGSGVGFVAWRAYPLVRRTQASGQVRGFRRDIGVLGDVQVRGLVTRGLAQGGR